MVADEAAWVKWFEDGLVKAHAQGDFFDREAWNNDDEGGPQRPQGSKELEDAYATVWLARAQEEYRRGYAEEALADLNECLAEVTRLTTEEQNVSSNR